ncbi:hypothetical protein XENOCAPTIV_029482 [Xenoophorus captivus]|uniref:Nudix hydrolase domain-containing protein n=1 Tax=Xenoophorus captivus TaxID=1517983 RepID=A0ABV0RWH8_9TELE
MVDPEVSILLHCAHWRGLLENQLQVELSDRLHSFCLASPEHHCCFRSDRAEQQGDHRGGGEAAQDCVDIINGCIVQTADGGGVHQKVLSHFSPTCSCSKSQLTPAEHHPSSLLTLRLGLTCYKDYLGTNWSCKVAELCQRGQEEFGDPVALLAQPLGVGAVLCTRDGQVVFIRRSQKVAEAAGLLDIPGGHPEPKAVCEHLGERAGEEQISVVMMQQRPDAIVSELFSSVCAEIRDEVNIPLSSLGAPVLMGVALNHTSAGRPSAEFYVRSKRMCFLCCERSSSHFYLHFLSCSLSSDEVRKLYWKGGAEANESTDAVFLCRTVSSARESVTWFPAPA